MTAKGTADSIIAAMERYADLQGVRSRDEAVAEIQMLADRHANLLHALIGEHKDNPRWTWLPGVIEFLRKHAAEDAEGDAAYQAADALESICRELQTLGISKTEDATTEPTP